MYQVNDMVMYGHSDVCKITDVCKKQFSGIEEKNYYIMSPAFENNSTIYLPTENAEIKLRNLISEDEIHLIINNIPDLPTIWIDDDKQRQEAYRNMLRTGDHRTLISLIITLYHKREEKKLQCKKFRATDEKFLSEAEKLINHEFAVVLGITPEEIPEYIRTSLEKTQ